MLTNVNVICNGVHVTCYMLRRLHVGRFDGVILRETTIGMIFMKL